MNLNEITKAVQRALPGVAVDGVAGGQTMLAIYHHLQKEGGIAPDPIPAGQAVIAAGSAPSFLNARSLKTISSLDPEARDRFISFCELAQATAATYGCEYIAISGYRTWEEQAQLYKACQEGGPHAVPAGYSMHNYRIAADFGVFQGKGSIYLDGGNSAQQALASKVHLACSAHAAACGLISGENWTGKSRDEPHYQIDIGHATPTTEDREKFSARGSIL